MIFPVAGESSLVYTVIVVGRTELRGVRTAPTAVLHMMLPLAVAAVDAGSFHPKFPVAVIRGNATVAAFPKCNLQSVRAVWPIIAVNATKQ